MTDKTEDQKTSFSVAERVLATFVDAVADEKDLSEVAIRLREVLLSGNTTNEAALRYALFGKT